MSWALSICICLFGLPSVGSWDSDSSRWRRGHICMVKSRTGADVREQTVECCVSVPPACVLASTTPAGWCGAFVWSHEACLYFSSPLQHPETHQVHPPKGLGCNKGDPQQIKCSAGDWFFFLCTIYFKFYAFFSASPLFTFRSSSVLAELKIEP